MIAAFRLPGRLAQEVGTFGELAEQLIVKVVAVGQHHDGRRIENLLEQMGVEHHRQRFSASLGMPENTTFPVGLCGFRSGGNRFFNGEILMIGSQNLCIGTGKADEVFDNVKQTGFVENTLNKSVELGKLGVFITAVFGFPLHEAVFPGGDRSGFGGGKVAHHEKRVVNEERRDFVHVIP